MPINKNIPAHVTRVLHLPRFWFIQKTAEMGNGGELVETSRLWGRIAARIDPEWWSLSLSI